MIFGVGRDEGGIQLRWLRISVILGNFLLGFPIKLLSRSWRDKDGDV